jgi:hypothetical protein
MVNEQHAVEPPHPFRDPAWYDPKVEHRPCQCPRCQGGQPAVDVPPKLMVGRIILVALGGILLPIVSVLINLELRVVELGTLGTVAILISVAATLANLVLYPRRKVPAQLGVIAGSRGRKRWEIVHAPPGSATLRVLLLVGALFSCLTWGYLALLFLPLAPISVIAIIALGLGLCGLCPHLSVTVSVIQAVHAARAVSRRLGRRWALAVVLGTLLLPPALLAGLGVNVYLGRAHVRRAVDRIADTGPHSVERMQAIARLEGLEDRLVDCYLATQDRSRHALYAEAYLRLTDRRINEPVYERLSSARAPIQPLWFLSPEAKPIRLSTSNLLWRM